MKKSDFGNFCDWGIVYSMCAVIFFLPVSIALLDSFAGLAISFYFAKKIQNIIVEWPVSAAKTDLKGKLSFIWQGLCPPVNVLNLPLQLLSLAIFISVIFSQYPLLSLFAFFGKFIKCVFLYLCFLEVFNNEERIWTFLKFFMASAFIASVNGVIEHYIGKDLIKGQMLPGDRVNSVFQGANEFGPYLLPAIALTVHFLYSLVSRYRSWPRIAALTFLLVLLLSCLCWTYSRSSWVGFLVILLVMSFLDKRKALFSVVLFLIFIFIFLPSLNNVRHLRLIRDDNSVQNDQITLNPLTLLSEGGSGRSSFWKKAVSIIRSSPIHGTGLNTYARILKRDSTPNSQWYAHNSYLQVAAETGLVGLACYLWLLFVFLRYSLSYCKQLNDLWPLTILQGGLAGLIGFLAQSFFDNSFFTVQLVVYMWLIMGLIMAVTRLKTRSS